MITRCDHCESKFEVSNELVYSNDPQVRCGECMSLFDARANLFNENEYRSESARLKPVQKKAPAAKKATDTADSQYLETADTVAVEHFYTSTGSKGGTVGGNASANHSASNSVPAVPHYGTQYRDETPAYRPDRSYPAEFEFERTVATETALPDNSNPDQSNPGIKESIYRPVTRPTSPDSSAPVADRDRDADAHRRMLREREHRALQMEPERDYKSLSRVDAELEQTSTARDQAAMRPQIRPQSSRTRINDRDVTGDMDVVNRSDSNFIPDDVLNRTDVIRDNGRRGDDALQFKPDTPTFDQTYTRKPQRSVAGIARPTTVSTQQREQKTRTESSMDSAVRRDYVSAQNQSLRESPRTTSERPVSEPAERADSTRRDRRSTDRTSPVDTERNIRPARPLSSETSAQEMRRFQHSRPSSNVTSEQGEMISAQRSQTAIAPRSKAGAVFWVAGLFIAMGLLLFSARSLIAGMNLPEPVISVFCQVTGCVPAQAKKDVSQLQIMRERLYPHPEIENALVISIDVVNNSIYKQPLPILDVRLLDAGNETVGERDFGVTDYQVVDSSEPGFLMPGEPTRIMIEVIDTGIAATGSFITFK